MLAIEQSTDATLLGTRPTDDDDDRRRRDTRSTARCCTKRARRLALQLGMGKTAVVIASVLANPSTAKPVDDATFQRLDDIKAKRLTAKDASMAAGQGTPYKTTLIIVNNTGGRVRQVRAGPLVPYVVRQPATRTRRCSSCATSTC